MPVWFYINYFQFKLSMTRLWLPDIKDCMFLMSLCVCLFKMIHVNIFVLDLWLSSMSKWTWKLPESVQNDRSLACFKTHCVILLYLVFCCHSVFTSLRHNVLFVTVHYYEKCIHSLSSHAFSVSCLSRQHLWLLWPSTVSS